MTRNIRVFLVTEAILAACGGFILPIYVLYFRCYQITLFQVALLAAVFEATVLIGEIPTGLFADRYGRKLSVFISFVLYAASGVVFITVRDLTGFIAGEILFGLAEAFVSGAAEALAVDSIPEPERAARLPLLYTWRSRVRIGLTVLFMSAAGYLFAHNVSIAFYPIAIGGVVGAIVSLFSISDKQQTSSGDAPRFLAPIGIMFRQLKLLAVLRTIFVISLVANFSYEGADQYWQVLGSELSGMNVSHFGLITAAGAIIAFLLVGPVVRRFSGNIGLPLIILLAVGVIISSLPNLPPAFLPYLLVIYFACRQITPPVFSVAINREIGSSGRATVLSGYNLVCSMGEVGSGLLVGVIASRLGVPVVFVVCGAVLVLFVVGSLFFVSGLLGHRRKA